MTVPATTNQKDGSGAAPTPEQTQACMRQYYHHFFPSQLMSRWLAYGNGIKGAPGDPTYFKRREFCFTLEGDIFARYKSYPDASELAKALRTKVPTKIDIGPVYTQDPEKRAAYQGGESAASGFQPVERELVFDIDLTDYDDVRNSASGTSMSRKCWSLMHTAIQVIDKSLRQDFGFKHVIWVYSGRRGIHCWVCDEKARKLNDDQRAGLANYLAVYRGQEKGVPRVMLHNKMLNPAFIESAYDTLLQNWEQILHDQEILTTERTRKLLLKIVVEGFLSDCESVATWEKKLQGLMRDHEGDPSLNRILWDSLTAQASSKNSKHHQKWQRGLQSAVFSFCYPRLDIEVSKKMNHLLKAPFCVHPKTGKVCIPIDAEASADFDPEDVPTVQELVKSLSSKPANGKDPVANTRMDAILKRFEADFLVPLEKDAKEKLLAAARDRNAQSLQW